MNTLSKDKLEHILAYAKQQKATDTPCKVPPADMVAIVEMALRKEREAAVPVLYASEETLACARAGELHVKCLSEPMGDAVIPLFTVAQPVAVPDAICVRQAIANMENHECDVTVNVAYKFGWNDCRAAMLSAPAQPAPVVVADDFDRSRAGFEKWAAENYDTRLKRSGTGYAGQVLNQMWQCWCACRSAMLSAPAQPVAVPDGWKIVPTELTQEMAIAAAPHANGDVKDYYRALLSAAPEQPVEVQSPLSVEHLTSVLRHSPLAPSDNQGRLNNSDKWIPCSERMPGHCDGVFAWCGTGDGYAVEAYFDGAWYRTLTDEPEHNVTHWMSLPAAPGKEG